jgi:hypothetical protein
VTGAVKKAELAAMLIPGLLAGVTRPALG